MQMVNKLLHYSHIRLSYTVKGQKVKKFPFADQQIGQEQLNDISRLLEQSELNKLWQIIELIGKAWSLETSIGRLRGQWVDMIEARCESVTGNRNHSHAPRRISFVSEYINSIRVLDELEKSLTEAMIIDRLFFSKYPDSPITRQDHMKKFVIDDFIKFLILSGGFKQFGDGKLSTANYRAYMKGSRFAEQPPVRRRGGHA